MRIVSPNERIAYASLDPRAMSLLSRMIRPLGVPFQLRRIEIDLSQISARIASCFIVEVRRIRISALAAGGHSSSADARSEFDRRHETVPVVAVPLFRV